MTRKKQHTGPLTQEAIEDPVEGPLTAKERKDLARWAQRRWAWSADMARTFRRRGESKKNIAWQDEHADMYNRVVRLLKETS